MDDQEKGLHDAALRLASRVVDQLLTVCKTPDFAMLVVEEMIKRLRALGAKTAEEHMNDEIQKEIDDGLAGGTLERACSTCEVAIPDNAVGVPCARCGSTSKTYIVRPRPS
jgi:hypothetical protein